MARPHWTLLLVPDDQTSIRQVRVSRPWLGAGAAVVLLVAAALGGTASLLLAGGVHRLAEHHLASRNVLLESQLTDLRTQMDTLQTVLEQLSDRDQQYRLLAGLDPLDQGVRQAGIGGPGGPTLLNSPLWGIDDAAAERTFDAATQLSTLIRRARVLELSWREAEDSLHDKQERWAATPSIFPTRGYISSAFSKSRWHPLLNLARPHEGLDIVAPKGTPVVAAANGRITFAGRQGGYGLMIEVEHGYGMTTRYAHLSWAGVRPGQTVRRGEMIGRVGESGLAAGPHLHYEVLVNGHPTNPRRYIFDTDAIPD